ncbi:MAG: potassium channel protein [Microscillaceae bacterium]|nr:potassium channel protein [Microscillaceae bacterium]MDW8460184.1 potassium channel protein [Cytophagales bacterium]
MAVKRLKFLFLSIPEYLSQRLNRFFFAIILSLLSITIGTLGFHWIEDYTWIEALYMSVITISTVGFGEVHPLSNFGKIFTSIFIIYNLAVFTFLLSIITSFIMEGELKNVLQNYFLLKKVNQLENHIILCGFGKNGRKVAEELIKNEIEFVAIDKQKETLQGTHYQALSKKILFIEGDATDDEILQMAGVLKAKAIITTLPKDSDSVYIALSAKQMNPKIKVIARANEPSSESKLLRAGADKLVRPDQISGTYMANLITRPEITEFLDIISGMGELKLEEFYFEEFKEEYKNQTIKDLHIRENTGVMILGFKDDVRGFIINPSPNTILGTGDIMIVLGTTEQLQKFASLYTNKNYKPK